MFHLFPRLKERRAQHAGSLSGGEQQMLVVARGLMSRPRLLMIDELSLGLAPKILDFLFPVLVELNRGGLSILLVEQIATRALAVTTRAYVMENGHVKMSGASHALAHDPAVMEAYLGKQH
jgi:branched-chain amino acid transport system ATP-binding protein